MMTETTTRQEYLDSMTTIPRKNLIVRMNIKRVIKMTDGEWLSFRQECLAIQCQTGR